MAWGVCLLFASARQLEFLSIKRGKKLARQGWLRAMKELNNPRI